MKPSPDASKKTLELFESFRSFHLSNPIIYNQILDVYDYLDGLVVEHPEQWGIDCVIHFIRVRMIMEPVPRQIPVWDHYNSYYARLLLFDRPSLAKYIKVRPVHGKVGPELVLAELEALVEPTRAALSKLVAAKQPRG